MPTTLATVGWDTHVTGDGGRGVTSPRASISVGCSTMASEEASGQNTPYQPYHPGSPPFETSSLYCFCTFRG